jgi:hypothetical protein
LSVFGQSYTPERTPGPGAPKKVVLVPAPELVYAQVDKQRSLTGRVEAIEPRLVFGTPEQLQQRLATSIASTHVNTAFSERANGASTLHAAPWGRRGSEGEVEPTDGRGEKGGQPSLFPRAGMVPGPPCPFFPQGL